MGRSHRRSASPDENNVGCVWGLIRMLYFRCDPKFLLDTKRVSGRHTFREITERGHSTNNSGNFEEIDEDDNIEEHTLQKRTVKKLMEDELRKANLSKKIPHDEVQKRLADLGNDISLDESSTHIPMGSLNHHTNISASYLSGLVDTEGSKSLNHAEEYDLESVLANFLREIYMCHNECPHGDCKDKSDLCPSLKSIIHKKLDDLNNPDCNIGHEHPQESTGEKLLDGNSLFNSKAAQSKEFKDALEILSSNKELFLKLLQKPNSHIPDNIQKHQTSRLTAKMDPDKTLGQSNFLEEARCSNRHELATKARGKESKYMFFWRKDKSNRKQLPEGANRSQPVSKIVILKPNPGRDVDHAVTTNTRSSHQQSSTLQSPEYSGRESSKFSIKEVRRRFRIVTRESRKETNAVLADDLQRDPRWLKDTFIATKKDSRNNTEGILADRSVSNFSNNDRSSASSKEKQLSGSQSENNGGIVAPKGASMFYEEAKKHLTDIFKDNNQYVEHPTVQISKSLEGMLSLSQCNVSSPRSNSIEKEHLDLSPEETDLCTVSIVDTEESAQERSQLQVNLESVVYCTSATVDDQVAVQEEYLMKEELQEGPRDVTDVVDTICVERTDRLDHSERICTTQCNEAEFCRDSPQPKMLEETEQENKHVQIFLNSPASIVEKLEQENPETPEPRSPAKLISYIFLEQSHEKQEQPSPVSVLDSFYKDVSSPDSEKMKESELHEDIRGTLYFPDNESDVKVFWEDKNVRVDYIKLVLELSELCAEQNLEVWYLEDELISPCLFEELQNQGDQIDDLKILFDFICEALTEIQERYFRLSSRLSFLKHDIWTPPIGENLIPEVDRYVDGYLQHSFPSTLDQIIKRDLEILKWMDIRPKTEEIVVEIWEFVLDEIIDEAVFDLWI